MPFDLSALQRTARGLIAQLPAVLVYGGRRYSVARTTRRHTNEATESGSADLYAIGVQLIVADFQSLPEPRDKVTLDGTVYRVLSVTKDAAGVTAALELAEADHA